MNQYLALLKRRQARLIKKEEPYLMIAILTVNDAHQLGEIRGKLIIIDETIDEIEMYLERK